MLSAAPVPPAGYYRFAVAQIDSNSAFVFNGHDLLCEPWPEDLSALALNKLLPRDPEGIRRLGELKEGIRNSYYSVLARRITAVLAWCVRMRVDLVAFPEYSIPAALLPAIHRQARAGGITVVAGTHHVTPHLRNLGAYKGYQDQPAMGTAVAPVVGPGSPYLVSKLTISQWEASSLQRGSLWELVPWRDNRQFAVLICLDMLHQENSHRSALISPEKLAAADFFVVISQTPRHSTATFNQTLTTLLNGYHRPSLFVNVADQGSSKIFVTDAPSQPAPEPLPSGEEMVMVWDVRLDQHAQSKPSGYQNNLPAIQRARASIIERGALPGYAQFLEQLEGIGEVEELNTFLQSQKDQLEAWQKSRQAPRSVQDQLQQVLLRLDYFTDVEHLRVGLRSIVLDDDTPALYEARLRSTRRALHELGQLIDSGESAVAATDARSCLEKKTLESLRGKGYFQPDPIEGKLEQELRQLEHSWTPEFTLAIETPPAPDENPARREAESAPVAAPLPDASAAPLLATEATAPAAEAESPTELASLPDIELGSPPLPREPNFFAAPHSLWALLHEQQVAVPSKDERIRALTRLGLARGWILRGQFRTSAEIDLLWWRDRLIGRERLEVIPETCPTSFRTRLRILKERLAPCSALFIWLDEPTAPKLRRELHAMLGLVPHAQAQRQKYDEDAGELPRRYVSLALRPQAGESQEAETLLGRWHAGPAAPLLLLLGDFGSGKTTTLRRWTRDLAQRFLDAPDSTVAPIFVDLRRRGTDGVPTALARHALGLPEPAADDLVRLAIEQGLVTLVYDGFDELLRRQPHSASSLLQQFTGLARGGRTRILLSCRTRIFDSENALHQIPESRRAASGLLGEAQRAGALITVMQPLDDDRIQRYLAACVPAQATALQGFIAVTPGLPKLAAQPLLISLIVALRDRLLTDGRRQTALTDLYRQYADEWMRDPGTTLSAEARESLVRARARVEWDAPNGSAPAPSAEDFHELRSAPFFRVEAEKNLAFVHASFLEYFLALDIARGLESDSGDALPAHALSREVAAFLVGIFDAPGGSRGAQLDALVRRAPNVAARRTALLASYLVHSLRVGVSAQLRDVLAAAWGSGLQLEGADFHGLELRYASLRKAHLTGAKLSRCNLEAADLAAATLLSANLDGVHAAGVDLQGACLVEAYLGSAELRRAQLAGADLTGASADHGDLREADLTGAVLERTSLCGANLTGGQLSAAQLQRARLRCADLTDADLRTANVQGADLSFATLQRSHFAGAQLQDVRLSGAVLRGTELDRAVDPPASAVVSPDQLLPPLEVVPRPVLRDGVHTWLVPGSKLEVVGWTPERSVVFVRTNAGRHHAGPVYAVDATCGQALARFDEDIKEIQFLGTGTRAVAICERGGLLLDVANLRVICEAPIISGASLAATPDGSRLLCQADSHTIQLLDTEQGTVIFLYNTEHGSLSFITSPECNYALLYGPEKLAQLLDLRSGKVVFSIPAEPAFSWLLPGGRLLIATEERPERIKPRIERRNRATAPPRWTVSCYETAAGARLGQVTFSGQLTDLRLSVDSDRLLVITMPDSESRYSSTRQRTLRILDVKNASVPLLENLFIEAESWRVTERVDKLLLCDEHKRLSVWSVNTGKLILDILDFASRYSTSLQDFAFEPDGEAVRCRAATYDRTYVETFPLDGSPGTTRYEDASAPQSAARLPAATRADGIDALPSSATQDKTGAIWLHSGQRILACLAPQPKIALAQFLSNQRLLVGHVGGLLRQFDLTTATFVWERVIDDASDYQLSPDHSRLIVRTPTTLYILNLALDTEVRIALGRWTAIEMSPKWLYLAGQSSDASEILLFSMTTGELLARPPMRATIWSFICEDRLLIEEGFEKQSCLLDVLTGRSLLTIPSVRSLVPLPGGAHVIRFGILGTELYKAADGQELLPIVATRNKISWSADGVWLVALESSDQLQLVRINLQTGEKRELDGAGLRRPLAISNDGMRVLVQDAQGAVFIVSADGQRTPLAAPKDSDGGKLYGAFWSAGPYVVLTISDRMAVFACASGEEVWNSDSVTYHSFYYDKPIAFSADGQAVILDGSKELRSSAGKLVVARRGDCDERTPDGVYTCDALADGSIDIYSGKKSSRRITLYPGGTIPYARSSAGPLSVAAQWRAIPGDLLGKNGRQPLNLAAGEFDQPALVAADLHGEAQPS